MFRVCVLMYLEIWDGGINACPKGGLAGMCVCVCVCVCCVCVLYVQGMVV